MSHPKVTVVIATYNRPDTLAVAIRSILRQRVDDWKLIVVGDQCDERTGRVVSSFDDERFCYINLPVRFGEQAGPNSVGIALADTEYIALLNHDDIWLEDHLEKALGYLDQSKSDIYFSRAAIARKSVDDGHGLKRPVFDRVNPVVRRPHNLYDKYWGFYEPVSTLVLKTRVARGMGAWQSGADMYRSPLQEWLLHAWRMKAGFQYGREITVLNLLTHNLYKSATGSYSRKSTEHLYVEQLLSDSEPDAIRVLIRENMRKGGKERKKSRMIKTRNPLMKILYYMVTNRFVAYIYLLTGWDLYTRGLSFVGAQKGLALGNRPLQRTGKKGPVFEDFDRELAEMIIRIRRSFGDINENQ